MIDLDEAAVVYWGVSPTDPLRALRLVNALVAELLAAREVVRMAHRIPFTSDEEERLQPEGALRDALIDYAKVAMYDGDAAQANAWARHKTFDSLGRVVNDPLNGVTFDTDVDDGGER